MKKDQSYIDQRLLVLYLLNEISQNGRQTVEAWMNESEVNRTYYESFEKTWIETGKIGAASVAFDTNAAWGKMVERIERNATDVTGIKKDMGAVTGMKIGLQSRWVKIFMTVAAVFLLGAVSVIFTRYIQSRQVPESFTSYAQVVQDTLKDGSSVVLNAHTKLTIKKKFGKATRTVELEGEAFFQVKRNEKSPFIIHTGTGQVKVLGTSFNVKAYPGSDVEVYVESGLVELSAIVPASGDTVKSLLKAGERGMIRLGSNVIGKPAEIGPDELFWANKKLIFQETKLSLVFDLLKKHYEANIEVKDPAILNCLLSATFTNETITQILEVVAASFDLTLTTNKEKFVINGKGCSYEDQ